MRRSSAYGIAGVIGCVALSGTIGVGYLQHRMQPEPRERIRIASPLSERQMLERRRARVADIAVAASTP